MIASKQNHSSVKTELAFNPTLYTSGLGVIKNNTMIKQMNSGFGVIKKRIANNEETGLAMINLF